MADFQSLDKDADGAIGFGDLKNWVMSKQSAEGEFYNCFN
jgi:Ca2+-binding EF-hand superfamily protein